MSPPPCSSAGGTRWGSSTARRGRARRRRCTTTRRPVPPSRSSWPSWARRCPSRPSANTRRSWTPRVSRGGGAGLGGQAFVARSSGFSPTFFPCSADSTGTHSLYTTYQDYEIMFHVSTMLPYTPNNRQQVPPRPCVGLPHPLFRPPRVHLSPLVPFVAAEEEAHRQRHRHHHLPRTRSVALHPPEHPLPLPARLHHRPGPPALHRQRLLQVRSPENGAEALRGIGGVWGPHGGPSKSCLLLAGGMGQEGRGRRD